MAKPIHVTSEIGTLKDNPFPIEALKEVLGLSELELILCGDGDEIAAPREQWNDGSNTLAIAPGVVVTYDRNYISNAALRAHGIEVIEVKSSELARGRGGPRCITIEHSAQYFSWVSMGEEDKFAERIALLAPYQVNMEMIEKTGNENVIFLHCLPAFHDLETSYGRQIHEKHGLSETGRLSFRFWNDNANAIIPIPVIVHPIKIAPADAAPAISEARLNAPPPIMEPTTIAISDNK